MNTFLIVLANFECDLLLSYQDNAAAFFKVLGNQGGGSVMSKENHFSIAKICHFCRHGIIRIQNSYPGW